MSKRFFTKIHAGFVFVLILFLAASGCATIFSDGEDEITFSSNVDKTNVYLDGIKLGQTPLTIDIDRKTANRMLKFTKPGYQTQEQELLHDFNMNFGMILDLTGTALTLTPMGINALSGNIIQYTPTEYHIEMEPEKSSDHRLFRQRVASMRFAAHNFADLQRDLATGEGEYLEALQTSFQINPAHQNVFSKMLKNNIEKLITADNGLVFWYQVNRLVKDHHVLAVYNLG